MAISEQARQALQQKLDEVLGPQVAWALMEEVSRPNWGELAKELAAHTRTTVFACIAAVMISTGVALAPNRL